MCLVVAGCVAQQEGEELMRKVPEIDMVMGPQYANRLGDLLEGVFNGNGQLASSSETGHPGGDLPDKVDEEVARLTVDSGVDNFVEGIVEDEAGNRLETRLGPWECITCPPGVIHGYDNNSLEPVWFQVMLGRGRPETMGYADENLYSNRDAHLNKNES